MKKPKRRKPNFRKPVSTRPGKVERPITVYDRAKQKEWLERHLEW